MRSGGSTSQNRSLCGNPNGIMGFPTTVHLPKIHLADNLPLRLEDSQRQTGTAPDSPMRLHCQMPHKSEYLQ